jgi:hypothetical protein
MVITYERTPKNKILLVNVNTSLLPAHEKGKRELNLHVMLVITQKEIFAS